MSKEVVVQYKIGDTDIKLTPSIVKTYLTNGADISMPEFKMFTELCKVRKLNPFLKEAYIIKFGNSPATIVAGKDAIFKRALTNPKYIGREQGIIVEDEDGNIVEKRGTFKSSTEKLVGGWAKVYRKDWDYPTYITVSFDEVKQTKKDGTLNSNWDKQGATMVEKVATVRALRETFIEELGGMISEDEAWDDDTIGNTEQITKQIDPTEDALDAEIEEVKTKKVNIDDV